MIVYALVSVGRNVLAEYTATFGTFAALLLAEMMIIATPNTVPSRIMRLPLPR